MKRLLVVAALAVLAGSAFAADIPAPAPAYKAPAMVSAPRMSWTGCYIGAGGGYGMWNQEHTTYDAAGVAFPLSAGTAGGRGYFGTVQGGCDYQFSQIVVGVFGDYDFASIKGTFNENAFATSGSEKLKWQWAGGGRIGWTPFDNLLTFFSFGYTQAHFDQVNGVNAGGLTAIVPGHTYDGYFLGSGYEYKFAFLPNFTWKTEYRFSSFGADRLALTGTATLPGDVLDSKKYIQTIRSELVWRFWSN